MLWDASVMKGYAIEAHDGRLGTVSDFLFEDASWMVRWLVVDTGHWLSGRKVLLPPSALGHPDPQSRRFPVKLTMHQVKDSPEIDTDRPVSRQIESHVYDYYGWDPYWAAALATPFTAPLYLPGSKPLEPVGAGPQSKEGDPHLRSTAAVTGYHIHATDGQIGHVEDFLVNDAGWSIRYLVVDIRNWWPGEQILISPRTVREINWADKSIHLNISRQRVKGGRVYDPSRMADRANEDLMLKYYRRSV
jgi:hypothetical protein